MSDDRLLRLQETDTTIDRLTDRRDALISGEAIADERRAADDAEMTLGELGLKRDELQRDATRFEREIDSLTQKEQAEQERMYGGTIVNTKELEAVQHEIESVKRRRSDREDELLAVMERREVLDQRHAAAETEAVATRARYDEALTAADSELAQLEKDLAATTTEAAELAKSVDDDTLELYRELRATKRGVGAAALIDGVCQGCHEQLSAVEVDRLKKTDGIRRCEHCRRILVL